MKTSTTAAAAKLYWSERGEISCLEHAPFRGTDTWVWHRWKPICERACQLTPLRA